MDKRLVFERREAYNKEQARINNKTYFPPTDVQFDVVTFDDLNAANKIKVVNILEKSKELNLNYTLEELMHEIRKYDTSVLDHLLRHAFSSIY